MHVQLEPVRFVIGAKEIERFLIENDFIILPKHKTNSAWALQGSEY